MSGLFSFLFPSPVAIGAWSVVSGLVVHYAPIVWNALVVGEKAAVAAVKPAPVPPVAK